MTNQRHTYLNNRERLWHPETSRENLLSELDAMISDPPRHRTVSIAIPGDANDGKTQIISQFLKRHPPTNEGDYTKIPAIAVEMSDISTVQQLSRRLLEESKDPDPTSGTHDERMARFVKRAKKIGLRMVFLDEFHDCADTSGKGKPFLRLLKSLLSKRIFVVPVGMIEVREVLKKDPQLANRFNFHKGQLAKVTNLEVIKTLTEKIAGNPIVITDAGLEYILDKTKGTLGDILDFVEHTLRKYNNLELTSLENQYLLMPFSK